MTDAAWSGKGCLHDLQFLLWVGVVALKRTNLKEFLLWGRV